MDHVPSAVLAYVPLAKSIATAVVILICGWIASKWVHRLSLRAVSGRRLDLALARFLASIARYLMLAATIIASLETVGIHTTSLVAILASAGLAVGLALQGSLGNFASGVMILFFRPFQLGDKISASGQVGIVEDIGLFSTTLVSGNNEKIIIPNTAVTGSPIVNFSERGTLRGNLMLSIVASAQLDQVTATLIAAARRTPGVSAEPAPQVNLTKIEADANEYNLVVWSKANEHDGVMHGLRRALREDLLAAGIQLADNGCPCHRPAATK